MVETQGDQTVVEIVNRIRVLESKYSQLGERVLVINQNMIGGYKNAMKEIRAVEENIKDIKTDINKIKSILKHLTEEASDFAKKDSLKVLEKYINLWNPLNFVTETDVKRIIKEELKNGKYSTDSRSTGHAKKGHDKRTNNLSTNTKRVLTTANKRSSKPSKHKKRSRKPNARRRK